ncbi:Concanavalin A-like lectin/glucanases superfamily [Candidatus Nanopelagicaceae bacterium]
MRISQALNPRRISRSLVTVIALTLLETVAAPIIAPSLSTPASHAVTGTIVPSGSANGTSVTIPAGVSSVTLTVVGGAGGKGGDDGNSGKNGTTAGRVAITIAVSPGDVLGLFAGNAGGAGASGTGNAGGAGGADTLPSSAFSINGTYFQSMNFAGAAGGAAGSQGSSGSGGGAGAASIATINSEIVAIAGGAGGGGGAGTNSNYAVDWNGTLQPNGTSFTGTAGTSLNFSNSCPGSNGNGDGGGGGGGGGGYYGGLGGTAPKRVDECSGTSGSPGGNYLASRATVIRNDFVTTSTEGSVIYTYNLDAVTTCSKTTQTVEIYTVEKITTTANCTWTVPSNVSVIDLFLIGGGGGGSGDGGGGGGGGAALSRTAIAVSSNSTLILKVGYGGAGTSWGYVYSAITGDSTTVTLATGATFSALGGSGGTNGPSGASGAGGVATNGGFSGGAGGVGGACYNVGTAGNRGVSNYYFGSQNTYAGGGGGGSCPNGAATTGAVGADGGGTGGYASSASVNQPGSDGAANRGGGGGGGVATGTGLKLQGGKGGSGVILIRYATNSADSFPASLTSALSGHYSPGDLQLLDSSRKGWIDSSGTNASVTNANITASGLTITNQDVNDNSVATGSTKSLLVIKGTTSSSITIANLNTNYTLFHIARYIQGGTANKIFTTSGNDWTSGFYWGEGVAYHYNWLTPDSRSLTRKWQLTTDQQYMLRANGTDNSYNRSDAATQLASVNNFGINNYNYASDFEVSDILIFNRKLSISEVNLMEIYLARVNGLTLDPLSQSSETDTAADMTDGHHYYGNWGVGNQLSDTFTIEAWINVNSACDGICQILVKENVILLGVHSGTLRWAMWGKVVGGWNWTDTGIKIPPNEWHHVSMVKQFTGDKNGSLLFYLDGQLAYTVTGSPYVSGTNYDSTSSSYAINDDDTTWTWLGRRGANTQKFYGYMDEVKIWRAPRTAAQIKGDMYSNDTSSALLQLYLDFNKSATTSSSKVLNVASSGQTGTDFFASGSNPYVDIAVKSVGTTYTTIKFSRTYITQNGGWKTPSGISQIQAVVVGGGGGGGGGYQGGGGGAGGFIETLTTLVPGTTYPVKVGFGGIGHSTPNLPTNGETSTAFGISAAGGGYGSSEFDNSVPVNVNRLPNGGGSGGGGGWNFGNSTAGASGITGQGNSGGNGGNGNCCTAAGGGGAGAAGSDGNLSKGGNGGAGKLSVVTGTTLAAGGGGSLRSATTTSGQGLGGSSIGGNSGYTSNALVGATGGATNGAYGTGSGGGAGMSTNGQAASYSGSGGSGVVAFRYITATAPAYSKPSNAYLNVGMTETFTTNVAVDSATVGLTRTFKWESSTPTANGAYTTLKVGTGATNAAYGWVPSDTSTSGSGYLYRLTVTDSDTAGLFITDSSTAYAVINQALVVTSTASSTSLAKKINVSRNETYTITLGTPTYRATLTPVIPGITIDTSTAGSVLLKIGDTTTVGTWLETLTVTDSVSASVVIPLTITIAAPPNLSNTGEVIKNGLILDLDSSSTASYNRITKTWSDISGSNRSISTNGGIGTFSSDYMGVVKQNPSSYQALYTSGIGKISYWTIDSWVRIDSTLAAQNCVLNSEYVNTSINYFLCFDTSRTVFTGFYTGGQYTYMRTTYVVPLDTWVHLVGVWDGVTTKLYVNGSLAPGSEIYNNAGTTAPAPDGPKSYIGKWWDTGFPSSASTYTPMTIGSIKLYNIPLSSGQVLQNYNATKFRFDSSNQSQITPTKKYGVLNLESFTATSGFDTKTVTLVVGDRAGIDWDTSTAANQISLSVQESLTVGTYYDTITVTDSLGQSTYLPIAFTVTKADTLTVSMGTSSTVVYTGAQPTSAPKARITGLVGFDTATVQTLYSGTLGQGSTCATGGSCVIGDTGPGGGMVFYVGSTAIDSATGISTGGIYLEVAPKNWNGGTSEYQAAWAGASTSISGTSRTLGNGADNTKKIIDALPSTANLAKVTADLTFGGQSDWFFPSTDEVKAIYNNLYAQGKGDFTGLNYWASTQDDLNSQPARADTYWFGASSGYSPTAKSNLFYLRPVRAFSPTLYSSTTVPTDVDTYTATGTNLSFGIGLESNYLAVVYETSTLKITQANQNKLSINLYGAVAGSPFTIFVTGGSGTGAVTETITAGSTATNCRVNNHILQNDNGVTDQKTCNIAVTKAASRNYKVESTTATVYFMVFVNSQPTNQVGSGSTIALNGKTSLTVDDSSTVRVPRITGFTLSGSTLTINGEGFGSIPVTITFERYVNAANNPTPTSAGTVIAVAVPVGAISGPVLVITAGGRDSIDWVDLP